MIGTLIADGMYLRMATIHIVEDTTEVEVEVAVLVLVVVEVIVVTIAMTHVVILVVHDTIAAIKVEVIHGV
jgi:hypothetical protein